MGTNKRYRSDLSEEAVNQVVIRPSPVNLTAAEIGEHGRPPEVENPIPVQAWVRFPEAAIRVRGKAVAWSDRAVWVEFTLHADRRTGLGYGRRPLTESTERAGTMLIIGTIRAMETPRIEGEPDS